MKERELKLLSEESRFMYKKSLPWELLNIEGVGTLGNFDGFRAFRLSGEWQQPKATRTRIKLREADPPHLKNVKRHWMDPYLVGF